MKLRKFIYKYPKTLILIITNVTNWYKILLYKFHLCDNFKIYFRDSDILDNNSPLHINWDTLLRIIILKNSMNSFHILYDNEEIIFIIDNEIKLIADKYSLVDTLVLIKEQFCDDYYRMKKRTLKNKKVVDIGANIGDAAILFGKKGATVYSFEPISLAFQIMLRNVSINNLNEQIYMFNVALSDHNEILEVEYNPYAIGGFSTENQEDGNDIFKETIKIVEVIEYLKNINLLSCDILKIDCEGCENYILNDTRLLDFLKPEEVMVEYHEGKLDNISNIILSKYRNVEIVPFAHLKDYGIIYANEFKVKE